MSNRRRLVPFFVPLLFGLLALSNVISKPRFATYYRPDVVTLIAVGMCFGASIVMLVAFLRGPR
jgi:hypothetical protein